jgi:ADP-ribose pyrophosphatase YjhB (NUDIX family)
MPDIEIIARGLCMRDSAVLICRNLSQGYGFLPGGHVEFGESAADALARELLEEAAITSRIGPLLFLSENTFQTKRRHHEINLVFHVEQLGPTAEPPPEVVSVEPQIRFEWVDLAAIVDDDIRPPEIKAWLASGASGEPMPLVSRIESVPAD